MREGTALTYDLGGAAKTSEMAETIVTKIKDIKTQ